MKKHITAALATAGLLLIPHISFAQDCAKPFKEGDRIVWMGDSITHGGHYHSYVWLYYMTRFPDMRIDMVNAGMGGECAWDMVKRIDNDIFGRQATYATLTFGMNDTGYFDRSKAEDQKRSDALVARSLESFAILEEKLAAHPDMQVTMIGGSPFDETSQFNKHAISGKNAAMKKLVDEQREAAGRHGWGFVDFQQPMIDISMREQEKNPNFSFNSMDRVHPDSDGQMVMAYLFLKAQGFAGKEVASIFVDASTKRALRCSNCSISNIEGNPDSLRFDYLANALPYPVDSISQHGWSNKRSQMDALELVPFTEEFNREILRVKNLKTGSYKLTIDGEPICTVSSEELAEGINLAEHKNTPQYKQASAIMYLNEERLEVEKRLVEYLWVQYEYLRKADLMFADNEQALDYLREIAKKDIFLNASYYWYKQAINPDVRKVWAEYMKTLTDKIYSMNKPVPHIIRILPEA